MRGVRSLTPRSGAPGYKRTWVTKVFGVRGPVAGRPVTNAREIELRRVPDLEPFGNFAQFVHEKVRALG